jgi:hypothetical protein
MLFVGLLYVVSAKKIDSKGLGKRGYQMRLKRDWKEAKERQEEEPSIGREGNRKERNSIIIIMSRFSFVVVIFSQVVFPWYIPGIQSYMLPSSPDTSEQCQDHRSEPFAKDHSNQREQDSHYYISAKTQLFTPT